MKRGDVFWVDFPQGIGGEIQKRRPAVIVSNDRSNRHANRLQVIPLSTRIDKVYPCEALVLVADRRCKAMADQLTTIARERLRRSIGSLTPDEMSRLELAIKLQLAL